MSDLLFFDVETQKTAEEVGGWAHCREMLVSVAVAFTTADGRYRVYEEEDVPFLIDDLFDADLVVGFNVKGFDYGVLSHYTEQDFSVLRTCDIAETAVNHTGFHVPLDNLAQTTLGIEKLGSGLNAVRMFREGDMFELVEYCQQDVRITKELYELGIRNGFICLTDRTGERINVRADWANVDF